MSIASLSLRFLPCASVVALLCAAPVVGAAGDDELDARLSALEMRMGSSYARIEKLERTSNSDILRELLRRVDSLEKDNANLRGMLEESQHQLDKQTQNLRQLGLEMDKRIESLSQEAPSTSEPSDAASTTSADPVAERKLYEAAFNQLRAGKNSAAVSAFANYLKQYPQGRFADNAQYWLAEAYYVDGKLTNAKSAFNNLLKKYPRSSKVPDTLLKLGYIAIDSGKTADAKTILADVGRKYPTSNAAKLAKKRLLALGD